MTRVLLTAFEPYETWQSNASWLTLVELTHDLPKEPLLTTRRYPVSYEAVFHQLSLDLEEPYDYVILMGQAPGRPRIEIETVALNLASDVSGDSAKCRTLVEGGPTAYCSDLPAEDICARIREAGIPAAVSRHGGTFLCNASLYYTLHRIASDQLPCQAAFIHLPVDTAQAARHSGPIASLPAAVSARALRIVLASLVNRTEMA